MDVAKPVCDAGGTPLYGTQYLATGEFHYVAHIGNTEGHNSVPPLAGSQWLIAGGLPWSWRMCVSSFWQTLKKTHFTLYIKANSVSFSFACESICFF